MARAETSANDLTFLTIAEVGRRWQCSEKTVHRLIKKGELIAHRFGALLRVSTRDLITYERLNRAD